MQTPYRGKCRRKNVFTLNNDKTNSLSPYLSVPTTDLPMKGRSSMPLKCSSARRNSDDCKWDRLSTAVLHSGWDAPFWNFLITAADWGRESVCMWERQRDGGTKRESGKRRRYNSRRVSDVILQAYIALNISERVTPTDVGYNKHVNRCRLHSYFVVEHCM